MNTVVESLLSIAIPAVFLIWSALWLGAREDRETRQGRTGRPVILGPDPDAHLGRAGTE